MNQTVRAIAAVATLLFGGSFAAQALAQSSVVKTMEDREAAAAAEKKKLVDEATAKCAADAAKKLAPKDLPDGWSPFLSVGSTIQIGSASSVVGRVDGQNYSIGATVAGRMNYKKGPHEWNNRLNFQVQQSNTPGLSGWVKSLDTTRVDSAYVWSATPTFGVFASFSLDTAFFGTEDVRPGLTNYRILEPSPVGAVPRFSGDTGGVPKAGGGLRQVLLTKEFAPTTLGQGVGANIKAYEHYGHKVQVRVGLGAQEIMARGGVAINDDPLTLDVVEATRLQDFQQVGAQLKLTADGALAANVTYSFLADFLFPFYNSLDTGKSFANTINTTIDLKIGFKMTKWFSLEYVLGVRRQPLLVDAWQVWHGLLGSFAFNLVGG